MSVETKIAMVRNEEHVCLEFTEENRCKINKSDIAGGFSQHQLGL